VGAQHPAGGARLGGPVVGAIAHPGVGAGAGRQFGGANRAGITSRSYAGNALTYGNQSFNLANSNYRPAFYGHGLYHGYWNGNYGFGGGYGGGWGGGYGPGWGYGGGWGYGPGYGLLGLGMGLGYGLAPLGWGYGGWGLGGLAYNSGYLGYSNPYYDGSFGGYNYAQPIPVDYNASPIAAGAEGNPADALLNAAVAAFKQNDYDAALDIINKGIAQYPTDSVMHEFRGLVLFARGDYQQAAATIHSVLAIGPGWDWTTLASLYTNIVIYTDQLRALESYVRANPQDGGSRFLLGYHYMTAGHPDAAARQFQQVVTLVPGDRVAGDLLKMVSPPPAATAEQPAPQPPAETQPAAAPTATPVDPATLVGTWKAAREDGSQFELTLTPEKSFTWKFSPKQQPAQAFTGTYTVEVNVLALEKKEGGSLIGEVTPAGAKKFNFRLVGAPPEDKGLDFSR
jgi:tetratricopeptide (TPR) repeat protein